MSKAKVYAYIRKSTDAQNLESQKLAVYEYALKNGNLTPEFIEVSCGSRKSTKERRIDELMDRLSEGDILIVPELSRLGRSVGQVIFIVEELIRKEVEVICLKEDLRLNGEPDMQGRVMITLLSLFAEIERHLISERTKEGLARAKAEGKQLGRPKGPGKSKLDAHREEIEALLKTGSTKVYLARKYRVTPPTLYNWLKKKDITIEAEL